MNKDYIMINAIQNQPQIAEFTFRSNVCNLLCCKLSTMMSQVELNCSPLSMQSLRLSAEPWQFVQTHSEAGSETDTFHAFSRQTLLH